MSSVDFMNSEVWLHRNNHCGELAWNVLLNKESDEIWSEIESIKIEDESIGYISIGSGSSRYSVIKYEEFKDSPDVRNRHNEYFFEVFPEEKTHEERKSPPRYWNYLFNFLYSMNIYDYLIVPAVGRYFIFQIVGDVVSSHNCEEVKNLVAKYSKGEIDGEFKLFRKVKYIAGPYSRKKMSTGAFTRIMKYQGTNCRFNVDAKAILSEYYEKGTSISFAERVKGQFGKELVSQLYSAMTPETFESLIVDYLLSIGADDAIILPKNPSEKEGEEDADVEGTFENLKVIIWVQAKHKTKDCSDDIKTAIEQISKYEEKHKKDRKRKGYRVLSWVITSSPSSEVEQNKKDEINEILNDRDVRLIYGEEFASMLMDVGFQKIGV